VPVIELGHDLGGLDQPGRFAQDLAMTFVPLPASGVE
jgi:hypothetical protein